MEDKRDDLTEGFEEVNLDEVPDAPEESVEDTENKDETAEDAGEVKDKPKRKRSIVSRIVLFVAAVIFIISAAMLIKYFLEYKGASDEYKGLANEYVTIADDGLPAVDMDKLKAVNEDIVGWIRFEHIAIDYPIVQGTDNDYYLTHTFKKEVNRSASIFMDYQNKRDFSDQNTILYGHNMKDKSMFALLNEFKNESYFKENPGFYIYDFTGRHYYKIFSCRTVKVTDEKYDPSSQVSQYTISFKNEASFQKYIEEVKAGSLYDTGVEVTSKDKLVMLSTCTSNDEYRFVVQAVKVD